MIKKYIAYPLTALDIIKDEVAVPSSVFLNQSDEEIEDNPIPSGRKKGYTIKYELD
jgi:hypothetical protein